MFMWQEVTSKPIIFSNSKMFQDIPLYPILEIHMKIPCAVDITINYNSNHLVTSKEDTIDLFLQQT